MESLKKQLEDLHEVLPPVFTIGSACITSGFTARKILKLLAHLENSEHVRRISTGRWEKLKAKPPLPPLVAPRRWLRIKLFGKGGKPQ